MDALSIIDRGTQPVAPAKTKSTDGQQFNKALNKEQQVQQQHENKSAHKPSETAEAPQGKQVVAHESTTQKPQDVDKQNLDFSEVADKTVQQTNVQNTIADLLQAVSQNESTTTEETDEIKTLLSNLLQQLESSDSQEEQVFAGVDLSKLAEKLESQDNDTEQEAFLAQLVEQVTTQIEDSIELQQATDLSAEMMTASAQQNPAPVVVENQAQARQILQQSFDAVTAQKMVEAVGAKETSAVVAPQPDATMNAIAEPAEEVDPRFTGLLKPRTDQASQQVRSEKEQLSVEVTKPVSEVTQEAGTTQLSSGKQILENFAQQTQHNLQVQGQQQTQGSEINRVMPQTQTVQLPSGQQVAESQIFDQVVTHLSGSVNGDSGRMVLRLQPAELGSLRLELKIEGDRVQANLHAQSHQVQEVLERNLPQLRNALAEQGLKIDQFQVNVEQRQQSGQFENLAQQHNNGSQEQSEWQQQNVETEEQAIPLAHLMQNGGGGISLHV